MFRYSPPNTNLRENTTPWKYHERSVFFKNTLKNTPKLENTPKLYIKYTLRSRFFTIMLSEYWILDYILKKSRFFLENTIRDSRTKDFLEKWKSVFWKMKITLTRVPLFFEKKSETHCFHRSFCVEKVTSWTIIVVKNLKVGIIFKFLKI